MIINHFIIIIKGKITDRGIETPLGILSSSQIQQGEKILIQISSLLSKDPLYVQFFPFLLLFNNIILLLMFFV